MGQLEDIERLRKKRNRRQNFKRLAVFLLILAIFFGGWLVWEKIKQTSLAEQLAGAGVDLDKTPDLEVREYIHDMGVVMRSADLVICRAGASTISELTALGVPAIIVPSPNVTHNHQEHNAQVLSHAGGAVLILENRSL